MRTGLRRIIIYAIMKMFWGDARIKDIGAFCP